MSSQLSSPTRTLTMTQAGFTARFGTYEFIGAVYGYHREADTHAALTLLTCARPRRVLEVGTALGHMTANFTRWTFDDAQIFSLGIVQATERGTRRARKQERTPPAISSCDLPTTSLRPGRRSSSRRIP